MKPGYLPNTLGRPFVPVTTSVNVTSTSYLFSDPFAIGTAAQGFLTAKGTLGAGVTSIEFKVQQAYSADPADDWNCYPLFNVASMVVVANEYVVTVKPYVFRIDASTGTDGKLGPIPIPFFLPYVRLAYKVTGVGTGNLGVSIGRAIT